MIAAHHRRQRLAAHVVKPAFADQKINSRARESCEVGVPRVPGDDDVVPLLLEDARGRRANVSVRHDKHRVAVDVHTTSF